MPKDWTDNQKQAIYKKDKNILVSAAAGSRKNNCACRKNNK